MKISECSYCGIFAITEHDACETCRTALGINSPAVVENTNQSNRFNEETNVQGSVASIFIEPDNQVFPQTQHTNNEFDAPQHYWQPALDSKCLRCGSPVQTGQSRCFDCDSGKNPNSFPIARIGGVIAAVLLVFVGSYYGYHFLTNSPAAILTKYAAVTGADSSIVFESFAFSGEAKMVISKYSNQQFMSGQIPANSQGFPPIEREFSFSMVFQKPNKSSMELTANDSTGTYTAYKQAFDGIKGWKLTNVLNKTPIYEESEDAFADSDMGMGLEEYDSVEVVQLKDEKIRSEYGGNTMDFVNGYSTFYVEGATMFCEKKVIIQLKKKKNGKMDNSLMFFDEKTGFLIGTIKKSMVNGEILVTKIFTDQYKKFSVKKKGLFGTKTEMILLPTTMTFEVEPSKTDSLTQKPGIAMTIYLYVKKVEFDLKFNDEMFVMPSS